LITKLRKLAECLPQDNLEQNPLQLNTDLKEANAIICDFKLDQEQTVYFGTDIIQFDQNKNVKFLLKNAKGNNVSEFPTIFLDTDIDKSIKKLGRILDNAIKTNNRLIPVVECFRTNRDVIKEDILKRIQKDTRNILSIRINNELIGESMLFKQVIDHALKQGNEGYYYKYSTESRGQDAVCYVCLENKDTLWGYVSTFNFYSSNEEAYIAGGFKKEKSWINYPVCPDCAMKLRAAKKLVKDYFDYSFHFNKYFLIPSPILNTEDFHEVIEILKDEYGKLKLRRQEAQTDRQKIIDAEEAIFNIMADQKDSATFTLFFYEENQSEFKILTEIEDILPSRIRQIIDAERKAEKHREFRDLKGVYKKDTAGDLIFDFGILRLFFGQDYNNDFLDIISRIFSGRNINRQFILHRIMNHLSNKFIKEEMYYDFYKAMLLFKFLYALNVVNNQRLKKEVDMENAYEEYFREHPDFFDADIKKAIFLEGLLVEKLLNIQYMNRKAKPFRNRLNGLKIDQSALKRILPEAIEKLEQYKANYYRELEELISVYMVSGEPDLRKMSVDEISFYFTMGMNLAKLLKNKEDIEEGESHVNHN